MRDHPFLSSIGGVLGICEAIIPPLLFVLIFGLTASSQGLPVLAMALSAGAAVVFIAVRVVRREGIAQAVAGLVTVVASVVLALVTGKAENNFLPGIITNAIYGVVFLLSILVRWPLVGIALGLLSKKGHGWRANSHQLKVLSWITLMWVGMFAIRLLVEIPLFVTQNVAGLALAKLILGLPLYAPVIMLSWLFIRGMFIEDSPTESPANR